MPDSSSSRTNAGGATLWLSVAVLAISVLCGGGQGGIGDTFAQLLALALLAVLGWMAACGRLAWRAGKWVRWLPILALVLPVLQLLPIPLAWWAHGPARAELGAQMAVAGVAPIQVISLNPDATERALWSQLPPVVLFLAVLCLPRSGHRWLLATILALALLSVLLGMAQLAGGPESGLRFYSNTNPSGAVGFFANRNHLATLLVMALPLALAANAWLLRDGMGSRSFSPLWLCGGSGLVILLILGIAMSHSRAGLLLGMLAVLGSLPIVLGLRRRRGAGRILALAIGIGLMLAVQFAFLGVLQRLERDPLDDSRWTYAEVTREAAAAYAPLGSGLGTFRQAYQPFEARHQPARVIVNHAHNDYLELWLEGGVPALVLMAAGLVAWLWRGVQLFHRAGEPGTTEASERFWARLAWLSASMALLHSALDYPLRTTADVAVFAVLAGIAFCSPGRRRTAAAPTEERSKGSLETRIA